MGPEAEKIFEKTYQLYLDESGEIITFDDFFDKVISDKEFGEHFDTLFERSKRLVIDERKNNK
jgi:hypothetical protein